MNIKNYSLYVLKLEEDKWYVGVTANSPEYRFEQHRSGFAGANWTKLHKPLEIFDQKELGRMTYEDAEKYENKVVRLYIKKYGLNNVRGGDLCSTEEYIKRFGWYWIRDSWGLILYVSILLLTVVYFAIAYFLK